MSRIGNRPISLPEGTKVTVNGTEITVTGKLGTLTRNIETCVKVNQEGNELVITRVNDSKPVKAKHGLYRSLINNMVVGVTEGYKKSLIINGVGYKATKQGNKIVLNIGFSHPVTFVEEKGITFEVPAVTEVVVKGIDKEVVGLIAAKIRQTKPCEPYHNYGIRYSDEVVKKKAGKTAGKK